jgi:hypothetical protein
MLIAAAMDPAERPAFARRLVASDVYVRGASMFSSRANSQRAPEAALLRHEEVNLCPMRYSIPSRSRGSTTLRTSHLGRNPYGRPPRFQEPSTEAKKFPVAPQ